MAVKAGDRFEAGMPASGVAIRVRCFWETPVPLEIRTAGPPGRGKVIQLHGEPVGLEPVLRAAASRSSDSATPDLVAVGTAVARRPPHGSRRAELPHRALALKHLCQPLMGIGLTDSRDGQPPMDETSHAVPAHCALLATVRQNPPPQP